MGLTQAQRAIVEKARSTGGGQQAVSLDDETCTFLLAVIAQDLGLQEHFPELPRKLRPFFGSDTLDSLRLPGVNFLDLFERLVEVDENTDTYFACLAALHKSRLKYERILQAQPIPTIDQVGPRGLLQYGSISPRALAGFLLWRKWMFDIDNRAGQETGYLFEPIIASSIGGVPVSAKKSPVRRQEDKSMGRQVDCIRDKTAYEIKLRVTIAASGQGRWQEELNFPSDCRKSGYTPVLVVLDPTPNPKLTELQKAFLASKGRVYIGDKAWDHLESLAGRTMSKFLRKYVHEPINALLAEVPKQMPELMMSMSHSKVVITIGEESFTVRRKPLKTADEIVDDALPEDVDDQIPGP